MALETREEFLTEWKIVAEKLLGDDAPSDHIENTGNEMYDARVLAYSVAEEGLNLTVHRYFHGVASAPLGFMLQLPMGEVSGFLVGEYMFHLGFVAGMAHESSGLGGGKKLTLIGMGDTEGAEACLADRDTIIRTREELEQHLMPMPVEGLLELQEQMASFAEMMKDGPPEQENGDEERGYFN